MPPVLTRPYTPDAAAAPASKSSTASARSQSALDCPQPQRALSASLFWLEASCSEVAARRNPRKLLSARGHHSKQHHAQR